MKEEIKYVNYFHALSKLSQKMDNYAYAIGIIDKEVKRNVIVEQDDITPLINEIETIYNEIKDIEISVFIESLVLESEKAQKYFCQLIEKVSKVKEDNLRKILALKDVGLIYDNRYTQYLYKVGLMKDIFMFIAYHNKISLSTLSIIKPFIEIESENRVTDLGSEYSIRDKKIYIELKKIWLAEPKILIEDFLFKGIALGIWDENYNIITQRGSIYGTGKILLGSLSVALRGWAISVNTNYNIIGEVFCFVFNIDSKTNTNESYKSFQRGNPKYIKEFKRAFKIR